MAKAYLNRIATAVPPHDVHAGFINFANNLLKTEHEKSLFKKMAGRSGIEHRYSFLTYDCAANPTGGTDKVFYQNDYFPDTEARMRFYQSHAFPLAKIALDQLELPTSSAGITHIIITSCTGFYAPGLDLEIIEHYGLSPQIERTIIGFMGCYAAFNSLKLAHHIVRSTPDAKILMINLELCTLHLQNTSEIEQLLSFLIFADGCAASIISAEPSGIALDNFYAAVIPASSELITWAIAGSGFDMVLSGKVPAAIADTLPRLQADILDHRLPDSIRHWAVHPGGRSVLDAVQKSFDLPDEALAHSRMVLKDYGNMSSATVMFVLQRILEESDASGPGCAMAFGPGVMLESMTFTKLAS